MFITMFLEISMLHVILHYLIFLFVVEEVPLLWSHFVLQAASPCKVNLKQQYSIQLWSGSYYILKYNVCRCLYI